MLSKNQLYNLRKNIVLNSLYLNDYQNNLYIKEKTACSFFDSYLEDLANTYDPDDKLDILELIDRYDNKENLYNYYRYLEIDPLPQDDYIAYYNDCIFAGCLLYGIEYGIEDFAIVASYYMDARGNMKINKITRNKIHYDEDDAYIIKLNHKYYLKDFIKTNIKY